MLITGREAARVLQGVVPTREHARLLLRAGLAGPETQTTASLLYDGDAVEALAASPVVAEEALTRACPHGLYVARLRRSAEVDVRRPWAEVAAQVRRQPAMPGVTRALLAARITHYGRLPWVATLCGFVVLAADATSVEQGADDATRFGLVSPGEWATELTDRRVPTRRGRPWSLRIPQPVSAPTAR